jgi:hypothetical protein
MNKRVQSDLLAEAEAVQIAQPEKGTVGTVLSTGKELILVPEEERGMADKPADDAADFDWFSDDSIVLRPQLAVAIYQNERGGLVIRQERNWDEDNDTFIVISPENISAFIDKITDVAGIPSFGGPEPKPPPVRKR